MTLDTIAFVDDLANLKRKNTSTATKLASSEYSHHRRMSTTAAQEQEKKKTTSMNNPSASSSSSSVYLCRFFFQSNGACRNGNSCRFSHEMPPGITTREEALRTIPCPYQDQCRYGAELCQFWHYSNDGGEDPTTTQQPDGDNNDNKTTTEQQDAIVCGICLDTVQRPFGLLSCCNHVFCYKCLMEWRTEGSKDVQSRRVCPTCRKPSDYVVPSHRLATSPAHKQQILQHHKDRLSKIPCKKFQTGRLGSCPFGKDCFYAHWDNEGKDMKAQDQSMKELWEQKQQRRQRRRRQSDQFDVFPASDMDMITEMILLMGLRRTGRLDDSDFEDDDDSWDEDQFLVDFMDLEDEARSGSFWDL